MVLPSYYLPPVSWFVRMLNADEPILVEQWANYRKQTLHNRCWIDSPNGKLALTVPVDRSTFVGGKCLMKDVQISDHSDWQRQHWYALESSYFNSPFFEYLQDDFHPIYLKKWKWLMDLNEELVSKCLKTLPLPLPDPLPALPIGRGLPSGWGRGVVTGTSGDIVIGRTEEFEGVQHDEQTFTFPPYYQVFKEKNGFQPDLSIIDLIFNMGPESILYLNEIG